MQIRCKHCGFRAESLDINQDKALLEVMVKITKHIETSSQSDRIHGQAKAQMIQECQGAMGLSSTIILFARHTNLLDLEEGAEKYIQLKFDESVEKLKECLGIDLEGVEGESDKAEEDGLGNPLDSEPNNVVPLQSNPLSVKIP
jgi:hypothetical protein